MNSTPTLLYVSSNQAYFDTATCDNELQIVTVANSLQAINYINSKKPLKAIVCDYNLPGQNGLYLLQWLKQQSSLKRIPFILLSVEFNAELYKEAFTKYASDYFVTGVTNSARVIERVKFLIASPVTNASVLTNYVPQAYRMPASKRIFDIVVASSVLLLLSPLLLLIIIAIRLESKGKVYYTAKRVGRTTFDFYKLRSMRTGSDELLKKLAKEKNQYTKSALEPAVDLGAPCPRCNKLPSGKYCSTLMYVDKRQFCEYWFNYQKEENAKRNSTFVKIVNDPRITRVGKFIRNTSIDELPQLINVIKGDMSIVGNRPLPVYEAELLTVDDLSKRFLAPAGITGLWQVELRGKGGSMSEDERKRLDNEYADHFKGNNFSFWYDIKLILRTIPALLQKSTV